jgi:hypothetical protein
MKALSVASMSSTVVIILALASSPSEAQWINQSRTPAAGTPKAISPTRGGSACLNACKEAWRACYRSVCYATPGFRGMSPAKRAVVDQAARRACSPQWDQAISCARSCGGRASLYMMEDYERI